MSRSQQDRNNEAAASFVSFQGALHLFAVAIVGGHEVRADEQQDHVGGIEMLLDFFFPFVTCIDVDIAPKLDEAAPLERHEVRAELFHEVLIFAGVTAEDFYGGWHK